MRTHNINESTMSLPAASLFTQTARPRGPTGKIAYPSSSITASPQAWPSTSVHRSPACRRPTHIRFESDPQAVFATTARPAPPDRDGWPNLVKPTQVGESEKYSTSVPQAQSLRASMRRGMICPPDGGGWGLWGLRVPYISAQKTQGRPKLARRRMMAYAMGMKKGRIGVFCKD